MGTARRTKGRYRHGRSGPYRRGVSTGPEPSERTERAITAAQRAARRFAETSARCDAAFAAAEEILDRAEAALATAEERVRRAQIARDLIRENMRSLAAADGNMPDGRHRTSP